LYKHPAVEAVAVVAMPDEKWGETPCAFVQTKEHFEASKDELNQWCRENMASFKIPREFIFDNIPKTSTGKVQKFILRELITNQLHYQLCYVGLERNYTVKDFFSAIFYLP